MQNGSADPRKLRYRYLPILSWLLVVGVVVMLLREYYRRPTTEHQKRVAAFNEALTLIPAQFSGKADESELYQTAMKAMLASLKDPYSVFLDKPQMANASVQTQGEFGGVGIRVAPQHEGALIVEVQEGPARKAGVRTGDLIVAVDGQLCRDMAFPEISSRIRGKVDTTVELTLRRGGTRDTEAVKMPRVRILVESVRWRMLEAGIGHIQIEQFDRHCLDKVKEAIEAFKKEGALKALILDVRGNAGGLLDQAVGICDLFLDKGVIVRLTSRLKHEERVFEAHPETAVPPEMPIVVLADMGSASASEVLAGALQAHGRATIVGTRTFGKGAVNRIYDLADGSGVVLTTAHYAVDQEKTIEGKGVEPDLKVGELAPLPAGADQKQVEDWQANYWAAHQEQLRKAVELLKEKIR